MFYVVAFYLSFPTSVPLGCLFPSLDPDFFPVSVYLVFGLLSYFFLPFSVFGYSFLGLNLKAWYFGPPHSFLRFKQLPSFSISWRILTDSWICLSIGVIWLDRVLNSTSWTVPPCSSIAWTTNGWVGTPSLISFQCSRPLW